ncbi:MULTISPECIES: YqgE/AlgH family protein [unclassified Novosphingobium]|uniref:YqgE/AlgH family protein n=1 Tax=Novosphingobium TaxID=165696 RepID=UPI0017BF765F|nr:MULTISPECIES: YqgE/AlgH family protein [unclassified Novosphingobium]NKJ42438.1 putative transcriptional regulator [Novosphingobium sp. SG720]NMN05903.1 putative transcriptional regulator [Novosphingobium sp. SG919]NMN87737.1 putative transcriptional regulator [Novosphingobium sp. SG916]
MTAASYSDHAPQYLAGRLLLALPGMMDPRFDHAVIALCLHDANGALGIGLGEVRAGITFHALLEDVGIDPGDSPDVPVLHGGPVETGRGFVLHTPDWGGEGSVTVNPLCTLSASMDVLRAIAEGRGPSRWLIALGYAGWGPGQLEEELHHHGWHAAEGSPAILFDTPREQRWSATWRAAGIDPAHLAADTGHA